MGLFDLFKNKKEPHKLDNENLLETLLRKSASEAAYRTEFYKRLLTENLVVLTDGNTGPEGAKTLEKDTNVNIVHFPDGKIPVFTSTSRIFDKNVITEQVPFLEMKGEDLLNLAKGATFILNPYSDFGKELLPHEIESLLNGTLFTNEHKEVTVKKDTEVLLGQPSEYPTEIINALKTLFKNRPAVKAAYLGLIHDPSTNEPPHLIFAIDADAGQMQSITHEAGFTAKQFLKKEEIVDFIKIDTTNGLSDYFLKTTPFYKK